VRGFLQLQRRGEIEGIGIGNWELTMKMFADDTIVFMKAQENNLKVAWVELREYCDRSGQLVKNETLNRRYIAHNRKCGEGH